MSKLEEIRGLVERHCGDTKEAIKEAVAESMVALSPVLQQQQQEVTESGVCPGGAQGWNEFQKQFKEDNKERLRGMPYAQVRQMISEAWKSHKSTVCVKKTRTRKVKELPIVPNYKPANIQPFVPNIEPVRTFKMGKSFKPLLQSMKNDAEMQDGELYMIAENNPELANQAEKLREKLAEQQAEIQALKNQYQQNKGKPNNTRKMKNAFKARLNNLKTRKNQINQNVQTMRGRLTEKNMKKNVNLPSRHVRVLAPYNTFPQTPGSASNSPQRMNNVSQLQIKVPPNSPSLTPNKTPNIISTAHQTPQNMVSTNTNISAKPKMIIENNANNSGYSKVNINGKKYYYKENDKQLIERLTDPEYGNTYGNATGYYNESYPGYFRPE